MPNTSYTSPTPGPLGPPPLGADWNSGISTKPLVLFTEAGVAACYIFVAAGKLMAKFSATAPTSAADGVVIGLQT